MFRYKRNDEDKRVTNTWKENDKRMIMNTPVHDTEQCFECYKGILLSSVHLHTHKSKVSVLSCPVRNIND